MLSSALEWKNDFATTHRALADQMTYVNYGNKLVGVDDAITDSPVTNDFEDHSASALPDPNNPASWEYLYDGNGNMTTDANKGISVAYNFLNLPTKVDFGSGDSIVWVYTVSGAKLRKTVYDNGTVQTTIDYVNGYQYKNGSLDFFAMEAGRVKKTVSGALRYEYNLTDHLGNTRVSFADTLGNGTAMILQEDHYYAFGLRIEGLSSTTKDNKFTYNGKELEDEHGLNWYHYGARFYDAQIGRWHVVDPLNQYNSAYTYVANDPVNLVDENGKWGGDPDNKGNNHDQAQNTVTPMTGIGTMLWQQTYYKAQGVVDAITQLKPAYATASGGVGAMFGLGDAVTDDINYLLKGPNDGIIVNSVTQKIGIGGKAAPGVVGSVSLTWYLGNTKDVRPSTVEARQSEGQTAWSVNILNFSISWNPEGQTLGISMSPEPSLGIEGSNTYLTSYEDQ